MEKSKKRIFFSPLQKGYRFNVLLLQSSDVATWQFFSGEISAPSTPHTPYLHIHIHYCECSVAILIYDTVHIRIYGTYTQPRIVHARSSCILERACIDLQVIPYTFNLQTGSKQVTLVNYYGKNISHRSVSCAVCGIC